jgi:hypothetical protein
MSTPAIRTIGPMIDQVTVSLIGLPEITPKPCNDHRSPARPMITPSATRMGLRMRSPFVYTAWRRCLRQQ